MLMRATLLTERCQQECRAAECGDDRLSRVEARPSIRTSRAADFR